MTVRSNLLEQIPGLQKGARTHVEVKVMSYGTACTG